jgi:DNA-binding IclR family transcriptional regulator
MIVELLSGRFFDGLPNKELARLLKTSAANISRDLTQLADLGYARKLDNGCWSLTTKPLAIMRTYRDHYQRLQERMAESDRNILAGAMRPVGRED